MRVLAPQVVATDSSAGMHQAAMKRRLGGPVAFISTVHSDGALLQRKPNCACGDGCPRCQAQSNNLTVSEPHDPAEIEADQIADKVLRVPVADGIQTKQNTAILAPMIQTKITIVIAAVRLLEVKPSTGSIRHAAEATALTARPAVLWRAASEPISAASASTRERKPSA